MFCARKTKYFNEIRRNNSKQSQYYVKCTENEKNMKKYVCGPCGYVYDPAVGDPDSGIAPGTAFEDLPDNWCCPVCGVSKDMFEPEE